MSYARGVSSLSQPPGGAYVRGGSSSAHLGERSVSYEARAKNPNAGRPLPMTPEEKKGGVSSQKLSQASEPLRKLSPFPKGSGAPGKWPPVQRQKKEETTSSAPGMPWVSASPRRTSWEVPALPLPSTPLPSSSSYDSVIESSKKPPVPHEKKERWLTHAGKSVITFFSKVTKPELKDISNTKLDGKTHKVFFDKTKKSEQINARLLQSFNRDLVSGENVKETTQSINGKNVGVTVQYLRDLTGTVHTYGRKTYQGDPQDAIATQERGTRGLVRFVDTLGVKHPEYVVAHLSKALAQTHFAELTGIALQDFGFMGGKDTKVSFDVQKEGNNLVIRYQHDKNVKFHREDGEMTMLQEGSTYSTGFQVTIPLKDLDQETLNTSNIKISDAFLKYRVEQDPNEMPIL